MNIQGDELEEVTFSVIVPAYNSEQTICRALVSLQKQTIQANEIIIVDDSSTDNTVAVVQEFIRSNCAKNIILSQMPNNKGPSEARNHGWSIAKYKYVAFLDADDAWDSDYLSQKCDVLKRYPEIVLLANHAKVISESDIDDVDTKKCIHTNAGETLSGCSVRFVSPKEILISNFFMTSSVLLRRDVPYRFPAQKYSEDYALWLEVIFGYGEARVAILSNALSFRFKEAYGISGLSAKLWKMEKFELINYYRIWSKGYINFFQWIFYSLFSFVKYLRRIVITFYRGLL
ncbi:glycosyltransferase family 2 protein [Cardiobacteriaceae bacterium TAE3-ERU3]|nr:glycosyltransferase family 2 protein [Cardiobacteriaceae bacterium TAE3-ERU3]